MTATPRGPGRTLPASSTTQTGFLQEDVTGESENATQWVTAADVLAALAEINAAAEAAANDGNGNAFTGLVASITQSTTAKPGGTYFINGAITVTFPSPAIAAAINGSANRRITTYLTASHAVTLHAASGTIGGSADNTTLTTAGNTAIWDTDGTNFYKVG